LGHEANILRYIKPKMAILMNFDVDMTNYLKFSPSYKFLQTETQTTAEVEYWMDITNIQE
jgi:hypothetical protein